ncbi:ALQxL family class IV lanthipeptide [Kitasatospora azatica]|nr:ALQxL family class IV lanthipeptide [Kitasatospora azatica]
MELDLDALQLLPETQAQATAGGGLNPDCTNTCDYTCCVTCVMSIWNM